MRENETCRQEDLKQMSTEKLDMRLQAALQEKTPDAEVVLPILKELEEREQDQSTEIMENISVAWEKFKKKTAPQKPARKRSWIAGVAAAAVVLLVITAIPQTVGAESIFDVLVQWTKSVFEFLDPEQEESVPQVIEEFATENPGLQQAYDKITELGVTVPVVPMWLPEGFELKELKVTPMPDGQKVYIRFAKCEEFVTLLYWFSTGMVSAKFEKNDTAVEVYEFAEVTHFIIENEGNLTVIWATDNIECSVATNVDKDTVFDMIKSIYGRIIP